MRPRWVEGKPGLVPGRVRLGRRLHPLGHAAAALAPVRNLVGANMSFRRAAADRGRRLQPRARPGRDPAGRLRGDRPQHPRPPALARGGDPLRPRPPWSNTSVPPARGTAPLLPRPLPRRGPLEGGADRDGRQRRTASPRSAPTCGGRCRSASCAASATPCGATSAGSARAAMIFLGLARDDGRLPARSAPASPSPTATADAAPGANGGALRVLMVTPRSPLEQGGVERHVIEVSRRMAAAGVRRRGPLRRPRGRRGQRAETRDGVRDPHRPRLAARPRLVPGAGALARDRPARAVGPRPRPELPHAGRAAGDAAGADAARPLRRHLPRRRPLLRAPQPRPRPADAAAAAAAAAGGAAGRDRPLRDRGLRRGAGGAARALRLHPQRDRPQLLRRRRSPAPSRRRRRWPRSAGSSATRATTGCSKPSRAVLEQRAGGAAADRRQGPLRRRAAAAGRASSASPSGSRSPASPPATRRGWRPCSAASPWSS